MRAPHIQYNKGFLKLKSMCYFWLIYENNDYLWTIFQIQSFSLQSLYEGESGAITQEISGVVLSVT